MKNYIFENSKDKRYGCRYSGRKDAAELIAVFLSGARVEYDQKAFYYFNN